LQEWFESNKHKLYPLRPVYKSRMPPSCSRQARSSAATSRRRATASVV
jgi:hypothetical protein